MIGRACLIDEILLGRELIHVLRSMAAELVAHMWLEM